VTSKTATTKTDTNENDHKPKQLQTKMATKRYQNCHIHLGNEKSFGHQIFIITAEVSLTGTNCV